MILICVCICRDISDKIRHFCENDESGFNNWNTEYVNKSNQLNWNTRLLMVCLLLKENFVQYLIAVLDKMMHSSLKLCFKKDDTALQKPIQSRREEQRQYVRVMSTRMLSVLQRQTHRIQ